MKEHRPVAWNSMTVKGPLFSRLLEFEDTANERLEVLVSQLAKKAGQRNS